MTEHPKSERGRKAHKAGLTCEAIAAWFLRCKGYRILSRRYRTPVGEIDIVARRGATMVFVEVKNRAQTDLAAAAITTQSVSRMRNAIEHYLARYTGAAPSTIRLDVMLLTPRRPWPVHIRNAFGDQQLTGQWA
jgi:putative endonuclease